jgi:hypothetical protein
LLDGSVWQFQLKQLAFYTSTAFSPTDTAFLSRRAKVLMMVQALLSLVILAVLVSRAINALAAA